MKVTDFWEKTIQGWKESEKCGFCWSDFEIPLSLSAMNVSQIEDDTKCCVHSFMTMLNDSDTPTFRDKSVFETSKSYVVNFEIYFVLNDKIGRNVYNEIKQHDKNESSFELFIKPLLKCLKRDEIQNQCENMGYLFKITEWRRRTVLLKLDNDYTGIVVNGQFTKNY